MTRPRKLSVELRSIEDCTRAMGELLIATLQLESLIADRDQAVAKASAQYETAIDRARAMKADAELGLATYYYAHLEEVEKGGEKHFQLANGVMGRRASPPKLVLLNRQWTWGTVLARLREKFGEKYLRLRDPEIDKDLVKAQVAAEELKGLGLKLDQDEVFYAEPARLPVEVGA